ncbi:MAG: DMT family transporter [Opitutales bacterium]|nr:DMT family transporter [Opitutales bacterium]MCH8541408.1 DMT family transporter [Opitutales bacterium]
MDNPWMLLFPLFSALGYAVSALFLKKAMEEGAGVLRTGFVANLTMGLISLPFLAGHHSPLGEGNLPMTPFLAAIFFFAGQIFTFLALRKGDVSVATPLMGSKVIFVATFSVFLLPEPVPLAWWIAALLTFWSVWLLRIGRPADRKKLMVSILYALLSALSFAVCDVLVQRHGEEWGFSLFVPLLFSSVALASFAFVPFFNEPLRAIPKQAWPWLAPGAALLALQAMSMAFALSTYGSATAVNVVYSLRGILSIFLVITIGAYFGNTERNAGSRAMTRRFISGILILIAVILVLL